MVLATQSFSSIHDEAIRTALLGVGTLLCFQLTDPDARIVAGEFRRGVELPDDWQTEQRRVFRDGEWYVRTETKYHRPPKGEIASRLANLKGLVGVGNCLAKVGGSEHVLAIRNLADYAELNQGGQRALIIQRSRERYCRPRWLVERELQDVLWPDDADEEEGPTAAAPDNPPVSPPVSAPISTPPRTRRRGLIAPLPQAEQDGP